VVRVTSVWDLARSSFYAARQRQQHPQDAQKRGPKVRPDDELVAEIRELLTAPIFAGEGWTCILSFRTFSTLNVPNALSNEFAGRGTRRKKIGADRAA
jgi:hypothetical protein